MPCGGSFHELAVINGRCASHDRRWMVLLMRCSQSWSAEEKPMSVVLESAVSDFAEVLQHPMFEPLQRYRLPLDDYMLLTISRLRYLYQHGLVANAMWRGGPD